MKALIGLAAAPLIASAAAAQANCDWYARTALQQQQENVKRRCSFTGDGWSLDLAAHLKWCSSVSPAIWKAEMQRREQMLATACGKKS